MVCLVPPHEIARLMAAHSNGSEPLLLQESANHQDRANAKFGHSQFISLDGNAQNSFIYLTQTITEKYERLIFYPNAQNY